MHGTAGLMDRPCQTKVNFQRELRLARTKLLHSLVGIAFQEPGHRGWVKVVGVSDHGALVENADNPGDATVVVWDKVDSLIKTIAASGLGHRNADGWERKTGGGFVYDWPLLVTLSGWSLEDLEGRGISYCLNNRRKGGDESWVARD